MALSRDQLVAIFTHLGISYNVQTPNALNVNCPDCVHDEGNHCGVFWNSFRYSCWKCKSSGSLFQLLHALSNIGYNEYKSLISTHVLPSDKTAYEQIQETIADENSSGETTIKKTDIVWPPEGSVPIKEAIHYLMVKKFLEKRKLDLDTCITKQVHIGLSDRYMGRFIIPVLHENKICAFQARDMTGKSQTRYLTEGPIMQYLYGLDDIDETKRVILVEGIFDQWRVANNALACFSAQINSSQISLLQKLHPPCWGLMWDADAFWKMRTILDELRTNLSEPLVVIRLPGNEDPDSFGTQQVNELIECQISQTLD